VKYEPWRRVNGRCRNRHANAGNRRRQRTPARTAERRRPTTTAEAARRTCGNSRKRQRRGGATLSGAKPTSPCRRWKARRTPSAADQNSGKPRPGRPQGERLPPPNRRGSDRSEADQIMAEFPAPSSKCLKWLPWLLLQSCRGDKTNPRSMAPRLRNRSRKPIRIRIVS
jgi:hypothetical protein